MRETALVILPLVWLISEFQKLVWLRVVLGALAFCLRVLTAYYLSTILEEIRSNSYFAGTNKEPIETIITAVLNDKSAEVLQSWNG